jgi:hypothetical protein
MSGEMQIRATVRCYLTPGYNRMAIIKKKKTNKRQEVLARMWRGAEMYTMGETVSPLPK